MSTQDDLTLQVPVMSPPQATTDEHNPPVPPLPALASVPALPALASVPALPALVTVPALPALEPPLPPAAPWPAVVLPPEPALGLGPPLPPLDEVPALLSFGWPASPSGWVFRSLFAKQPATVMAAEQTAPFHHTPRRCMPGSPMK